MTWCCIALQLCVGGGNDVCQVNRGHFLKDRRTHGHTHKHTHPVTHNNCASSGDLWRVLASQVFAFEGGFWCITLKCPFTTSYYWMHFYCCWQNTCVHMYACELHCMCVQYRGVCSVTNQCWRIIAPVCFHWQFTVWNYLGKPHYKTTSAPVFSICSGIYLSQTNAC